MLFTEWFLRKVLIPYTNQRPLLNYIILFIETMNSLSPDSRKPPTMEPNEAYACILKVNRAYERVTGPPCGLQQKSESDFNVVLNDAYESVRNEPTIYEQISSISPGV